MEVTTLDLSWLCIVAVIVIMIPIIYYGISSRLKYAKRLLNPRSKTTSLMSKSRNKRAKTRFTKLDDFYKAVNFLIERLRIERHSEEAKKLHTLMHTAWTTSSELLGEIMLALESMQGDYSPELRHEIDECFEFALHHREILGLGNGR